jgi:hypothetical protein
VWPIRVSAHAFGPDAPHRDLYLSPDHAVFLNDVLIPIRYLVNDATIAQVETESLTYFHVELECHAVIFADGLACESYLDTGNRAAFSNSGVILQMHPDFARDVWATGACARLVLDGAELQAARRYLLGRAEILDHSFTPDADLRVVVDGCAIAPMRDGTRYRFQLPASANAIRLVSRSAVPAHLADAGSDHRRLGVAVARIALDGRAVDLSDVMLSQGWHSIEETGAAWRWTDGDAHLDIAEGAVLEIDVAITERYWRVSRADQIWQTA